MSGPDTLEVAGGPVVVSRLGEAAVLVTFGQEISVELNTRVHLVTAALRERALAGIVDLVPAYASLLIRFAPQAVEARATIDCLKTLRVSTSSGQKHKPREHVIPARYGDEHGPDLERLAGSCGLTAGEVIKLHTSVNYRVYFLGFLPGFAYMGSVPPQIAAPRLASPRLRVPTGSVAIAATQTAVYPFDSPGGWNLIGRTGIKPWNSQSDKPALFAPGDIVRFVATADPIDSQPEPVRSPYAVTGQAALEVVQPGTFTTVQDLGRPGFGSLGVPEGGATDKTLASDVNRLVGNDPGGSVLEIVHSGPDFLARRTIVIGLAGADLGCTVGGTPVPPGISWLVRAGQRIAFRPRSSQRSGELAYLAAGGGFAVPMVLGSASTLAQAGIGGLRGRPLRPGDVLSIGDAPAPPSAMAGRSLASARASSANENAQPVIRFIPYEGPNSAGAEAARRFATCDWRVSPNSNRMGVRLDSFSGERLPTRADELISFGAVRGAIQLPPGGDPIVLGPDHGTTGGYPIIGVVIRADWPLLANVAPGRTVRFEAVTLEAALNLLAGE